MTIVDYDKKMAIIEDFYSQAIEIVNIVHDSIKGFHYVNGYNLLEGYDAEREQRDINLYGYSKRKEFDNRKKQLLIELGRAGEYAIKYILLLKQMEDYPNQDIVTFKKKAIYSIADKAVGNTYVNDYHINRSIVDDIKAERDNNHELQPLHDYSYLFYILKKLYPVLSNKVYESFTMDIMSNNIEKINIDENIKQIMMCFPQCEWMATNLFDLDMQPYVDEYDRIRNESGDSFVRLRYIENNEDNKQYDFESVLYYLDYLTFHIGLIHNSNNNVNGNIPLEYNKYKFKYLANMFVVSKLKQEDPKSNPTALRGKYLNHFEDEFKRVDEAFKTIENNYESIIKSFNYYQIRLYEQLTGNKTNVIEMYENIMNNIGTFEKYPQLFGIIPMLLSSKNNIEIFDILKSNGLDINNIQESYSNIFCVPSNLVKDICAIMNEKGEQLIVNNQINEVFFKYLEAKRVIDAKEKNPDSPPPLPLRHR